MEDLLHQMGVRISARRKQIGMTQEELAERTGVTPQTISTAELGKKGLRAGSIVNICTALQISPNYLLQGEISDVDFAILAQKISRLSPAQYHHLEDIIDSYISALEEI